MTVVTIKCGKCGAELVSVEREGGVCELAIDPCPTCLVAAYDEGAGDADSEWETVSDASWDDDEEDEDDYEDDDWEEDEDDEDYYIW
jgi:Zn-finger nucleic acid-binding protein